MPQRPSASQKSLGPLLHGLGVLLRSREISVVLVLVFVVAAATFQVNGFLFSSDSWRDLWLAPSIYILLAVGEAVVIITRNVDLSVSSVLGFTAWMTGSIFRDHPNFPIFLAFLIAAGVGAGLGLVNGALTAFGKVPSLVITLGTLYIYRSVVVVWAGSGQIHASDIPSSFSALGVQQIFSIPVLTIFALVALVAVGYYTHTARGGRELYAIGSDPDAALLYGLKVRRRIVGAFVLSGTLAGFAGAMFVARYGTVSSHAGEGLELWTVAAVVIGGVAIFGGSGTVWGAALGALLLVTIGRALPVLGIPEFWQQAVVGGLILGSIVLDRFLAARRSRRLVEEREPS